MVAMMSRCRFSFFADAAGGATRSSPHGAGTSSRNQARGRSEVFLAGKPLGPARNPDLGEWCDAGVLEWHQKCRQPECACWCHAPAPDSSLPTVPPTATGEVKTAAGLNSGEGLDAKLRVVWAVGRTCRGMRVALGAYNRFCDRYGIAFLSGMATAYLLAASRPRMPWFGWLILAAVSLTGAGIAAALPWRESRSRQERS